MSPGQNYIHLFVFSHMTCNCQSPLCYKSDIETKEVPSLKNEKKYYKNDYARFAFPL